MIRSPVTNKSRHGMTHARRGSWLAQMVITMSVLSVLMTVAATALFRMYRQEASMVRRTVRTAVWQRLNRDFRRDVHAALAISPSEDGTELVLLNADSRITWRTDGDVVKRVLQESDSTVPTESIPGEQYAFAESSIRFVLEASSDAARQLASVEVTPPPAANGGIGPASVAVAAAGLDHRFSKPNDVSGAAP